MLHRMLKYSSPTADDDFRKNYFDWGFHAKDTEKIYKKPKPPKLKHKKKASVATI